MSAAQQEFDALFSEKPTSRPHPDDSASPSPSPSPEPEHFYENDDLDAEPLPHDTRSRDVVPRLRSSANTGPKGVIADAQAFEEARRAGRYAAPPARAPKTAEFDGAGWEEEGLLGSEDEEEGDGGFMERWRRQRLRELQRPGQGRSRSREGSPGKKRRVFGSLVEVDGTGYLEAVEGSGAGTVVVVFICDDMSEISEMVEDCVKVLARKHPTTRFVKLDYEEAEMEGAGVPAILAYREEKFAGLVPVVDEIPDDAELNATSLEAALKRYQILF
ncbi:hypothetical protein H2199_007199 [Coniosporium tulheliwenetii]|uniref:Uncharacterized protein n=1 Tax=Coniosporium tulheliwenetii TaxID=3383036 RepID=A0ACC2YQV7_9PEZI|nr:hypothetical protein H2199_007199 [Cladosporium sp. JES 115]